MASGRRPATTQVIDATNVTDNDFSPRHQTPGNYVLVVKDVWEDDIKSGDNKGEPQWVFQLALASDLTATYPYRIMYKEENQAWKSRNLWLAAGLNVVEKKKYKLNPNNLKGKKIGAALADKEYNDRLSSEVVAVMPVKDVGTAPKPAAAKKAAAADPDEITEDVATEDFTELDVADDLEEM